MRPVTRADALERYRELPVPDTAEEHWRFTNLRGFDPESFSGSEAAAAAPSPMVALDVGAEAVVTETGIEITRRRPRSASSRWRRRTSCSARSWAGRTTSSPPTTP